MHFATTYTQIIFTIFTLQWNNSKKTNHIVVPLLGSPKFWYIHVRSKCFQVCSLQRSSTVLSKQRRRCFGKFKLHVLVYDRITFVWHTLLFVWSVHPPRPRRLSGHVNVALVLLPLVNGTANRDLIGHNPSTSAFFFGGGGDSEDNIDG